MSPLAAKVIQAQQMQKLMAQQQMPTQGMQQMQPHSEGAEGEPVMGQQPQGLQSILPAILQILASRSS
jgi:hypothetical protein